ncbi:MAG: hypothetical protein UW69_C0077G0003 [Microgenomates group bacterium GW2011_GWA2_44_7]|nr:MAG: hypothetical protein UW69_C0077G0003 [Microgenomates group bacterium GW2011_GWA2_44_7]
MKRNGLMSNWEVTLLGLAASSGEQLMAPDYWWGPVVLYASEDSLTLKYTTDDNVISGYTVHLEGVCTDPNLLTLYNSLNASGRNTLPILARHQPLGWAKSAEVKVAIRDTGEFMDPRSRKDWWSTIPALRQIETNLATGASVTASTVFENLSGYNFTNAIDKKYASAGPYEWASNHELKGAWLKLSWNTPVYINKVLLFDRNNLYDQIKRGSFKFSDGSSLAFRTLPNSGETPLEVSFSAKTTS